MPQIKRRVLAAILTIAFSAITVNPANAATANSLSPTGQKTYGLVNCLTAQQLDCIESVSFYENGILTPAKSLGLADESVSYPDPQGNTIEGTKTVWQTNAGGRTSEFRIHARLATTDSVLFKTDTFTKTGSELFVIFDGPDDDLTTKLQIKVRTSWVKPENVTLHAWEPLFLSSPIAGGTVWTFEGIQTKTLGYSSDYQAKMKAGANADFEGALLDFHVHHAGVDAGSSFFDPKCAKAGYTIESSNAGGGGRPYWNPTTKSVEFAIQAAHRDKAGNLNRGFFYLWVNKEYMKCAWPQSGLDKANQFTVSVLNEDGSKQVATTVVSYKDNMLKVTALNFHYSSPTIRLAAAKSTITCLSKANKTKKVTAIKPVCPTGYKIKK